ncbi:Phosphomethylpyrimidine kinase-domain-containing protein [Gloeopeniophorella convolvens]|nr:Phosphomethylpyrimidine kinase-domain-containing protein [Gloeopeniophorella convolvens]
MTPSPVADTGGRSPLAVLTIAGSDSGGGAGIQADLKTFTALGCYGTSVVTALTAQNTQGVQGVHAVPPAFVEQQLRSVLDDIPITALKTGMLTDAAIVRTVAQALRALPDPAPPLVVDPVCVSTSGHALLAPDALGALVAELLPLATVVTPNVPEAALLLREANGANAGRPIGTVDDALRAARELLALGPRAVLLKGGHLARARIADVERAARACDPPARVERAALLGENMEILASAEPEWGGGTTHGTGCTLSAALACALARGDSLLEAVESAAAYTHHGIARAFPLGSGHGPLNHMHPLLPRAVSEPTAGNPHPLVRLLIRSNADVWRQYVQHDFVQQLGRGTLARERFVHFIVQDYHYLKYYARANGLLAAKSPAYADFAAAAQTVLSIVRESATHVSFCARWGVDRVALESAPESPACTAYGAYILDIGLQGDAASLVMAVAACLLGYGEVGLWLKREAQLPQSWVQIEGNPYHEWIEDYSGAEYQAAVRAGIERIEALAVADPPTPTTLARWQAIWGRCTQLEKQFWDMAMNLA